MKTQIIQMIRYWSLRLAFLVLALLLLYLVYFFYSPSAYWFGHSFTNPIYEYISDLDLWLYLVVYFIGISLINVFILLSFSWYYNYYRAQAAETRNYFEILFNEQLINYIYIDFLKDVGKEEEYFHFFKANIDNRIAQEVLLTVMARQQEMIAENLSPKFTRLIDKLELKDRLVNFLYSSSLSENIIAMKIISYLRIRGFEQQITLYANHKNYVLRTEAMAALIRLSETNHLELLLLQQHFISMLDVNVIVNAVEKNLKADIDYLGLLNAQSPRVVAIGVMLIKIRHKVEYKNELKIAIKHNDVFLHQVAWEVFASFADSPEDFEFLIHYFPHESDQNKLFFLKTIERYQKDEVFFDFLDSVIASEGLLLKIAALRIFFDNHIERFVVYKDSSDKRISLAYREVVDFNII